MRQSCHGDFVYEPLHLVCLHGHLPCVLSNSEVDGNCEVSRCLYLAEQAALFASSPNLANGPSRLSGPSSAQRSPAALLPPPQLDIVQPHQRWSFRAGNTSDQTRLSHSPSLHQINPASRGVEDRRGVKRMLSTFSPFFFFTLSAALQLKRHETGKRLGRVTDRNQTGPSGVPHSIMCLSLPSGSCRVEVRSLPLSSPANCKPNLPLNV